MHRRLIYVPKTPDDMKKDWFGDDTAEIYRWDLSEIEFQMLWDSGAFDYINKICNAMIGDFEEEYIFYQKLYFEYENISENLHFGKFSEMIDKAVECRTALIFAF